MFETPSQSADEDRIRKGTKDFLKWIGEEREITNEDINDFKDFYDVNAESIPSNYERNLGIDISTLEGDVLDVGSSDPHFAEYARENSNAIVISMDLKLGTLKDPDVLADVHALPFQKESFDLVVGNCILFQETFEGVVAELINVIRPEGEIRLSSIVVPENDDAERIHQKVLEEIRRTENDLDCGIQLEKIGEENTTNSECAGSYRVVIRRK